jgi:hypothetical protein
LKIANKAQIDLPVPTADPKNNDSYELYKELNVYV